MASHDTSSSSGSKPSAASGPGTDTARAPISGAPRDEVAGDAIPPSTSPGNAGARGSRGQANGGAQADNSTQKDGNDRVPAAGKPDLRDAPAQGGGGAGSGSSRSE